MPVTVLTGIKGLAAKNTSAIHNTRKWTINVMSEIQAFITSATKAGTGRQIGNIDWNGQYSAYGHTPVCLPGDSFTFKGSLDGVSGC